MNYHEYNFTKEDKYCGSFRKFTAIPGEMNLIIDVGNTYVKLAVFKKDKIVKKYVIKATVLLSTVKKILKNYPQINNAILSSVGNIQKKKLSGIQSIVDLMILDSAVNLPFNNLYQTPMTLGSDRIALVSAASLKHPDQNVLIIDAGTCITYDIITKENNYLGGSISPGIGLRYKSLHNLTAKLPLLSMKNPTGIIGCNTQDSIHSGVINGVVNEINGVIEEYEREFEELTVILTGGEAEFLSKRLKSSIFANSNFLLEGLNSILEFNLSK